LTFPVFAFAGYHEENGFGTIKGTVYTADEQPASYVTVLIKNIGRGTVTDGNGNFEIKKNKTRHLYSYCLFVRI